MVCHVRLLHKQFHATLHRDTLTHTLEDSVSMPSEKQPPLTCGTAGRPRLPSRWCPRQSLARWGNQTGIGKSSRSQSPARSQCPGRSPAGPAPAGTTNQSGHVQHSGRRHTYGRMQCDAQNVTVCILKWFVLSWWLLDQQRWCTIEFSWQPALMLSLGPRKHSWRSQSHPLKSISSRVCSWPLKCNYTNWPKTFMFKVACDCLWWYHEYSSLSVLTRVTHFISIWVLQQTLCQAGDHKKTTVQ